MPSHDLNHAHLADAQRVLVVDDEESILRLLDQFFTRLGYECHTFLDGDAALAEMAKHDYALVITDMVMPFGISGLQFVEEVAKRHPKVPTIVMTGYPIIEAVTRCLKAGASDYVQKPFDFARLKTIVKAVLVEKAIESDHMLRNRLISGYRIIRPLKEDPFSPTFLAHDPNDSEKEFAIRIFRFSPHNARQRRRIEEDFRRSAQLASMISSPYVLPLLHFGIEEEGAIPFLVTENFEGSDLKTWCRSALPSIQQLVATLRDVARGLAGVHAAGLVHTDLTPYSVLVSRKGEVKVQPFTAARIRHSDTTVHDVIHGTPAYLAPEIFHGVPPSPRTDLFSLGVIAYELITGQRPFQAASLAAYAASICEQPHIPTIQLAPTIPVRLADTIDVLLEKDPEDRYPNAASAAVAFASAFRVEKNDDEELG